MNNEREKEEASASLALALLSTYYFLLSVDLLDSYLDGLILLVATKSHDIDSSLIA